MQSPGLEKVRADVKANLEELNNRAKVFGRVNLCSEKYIEQPSRPYPQYFAWSNNASSIRIEKPTPVSSLKANETSSTKNQDQDTTTTMSPQPVAPPQRVPKSTDPVQNPITTDVNILSKETPSSENKNTEAKLSVNNTTQNPSSVKKITEAPVQTPVIITSEAAVAVTEMKSTSVLPSRVVPNLVSKPPPPQDSASKNNAIPTTTAAITVDPKYDTIPSPVSVSFQPESMTIGENPEASTTTQKEDAFPITDKQSEATTTSADAVIKKKPVKKQQVLPRYMLPKTNFSQVSRDIVPLSGGGGGGGGGARAKGVLDQLGILCKQHRKQYGKCREDIQAHESKRAGLLLPKDPEVPSFFAWKIDEGWESQQQQQLKDESRANLRLLLADATLSPPTVKIELDDDEIPKEPKDESPKDESPKDESPKEETQEQQSKEQIKEKLEQYFTSRLQDSIVPMFPSELEPELSPVEIHSFRSARQDNSELKSTSTPTPTMPQQLILKAQRAVGQKHNKFQSEIQQGYIRRTEYMSKYQWPAPDLAPQGNIRSVSAFASRQCTRPAGMVSSYPRTFVGNSAKIGMEIAKTATRKFLTKKLVVGGIEDLERQCEYVAPKERVAISKYRRQTSSESKMKKKKKDWNVSTKIIHKPNLNAKKKSDNDEDRLKTNKDHRTIPNNFAWSPSHSKKQAFRRSNRRPKIQRWRPKNIRTSKTLENPILMYKRHPIPVQYRPQTEYTQTISRVGRHLLYRSSSLSKY